jgi:ABC-2 type transport system ATP-binding protein
MVTLQDITFGYKKNKPLFKDLTLKLDTGHIYGLLGKNGAGKSTLLNHISGLVYPQKGTATVLDCPTKDRLPAMLEELFVIPEEFELPSISIPLFVDTMAVFYPKFSHSQFETYLQEFEIPVHHKLSGMSFGQKKKCLIAFGLATNVRILILDEPTNGLDIPSKSQFRKIIASAFDDSKTIIISTHQVNDLENLIDTVVVLENGQIIFQQEIATIASKLCFEENINEVPSQEVLYEEQLHGRRMGITKNSSENESRVDLEILFNAIIKNSTLLNAQF